MSVSKKLYLVDGSGFIFRAYHALPPLTNPQGVAVGAVYGFCNILWKLMARPDISHIAVVFDAARKTFRNDIYPEYKAHRPPPPDDLIPQFALVREAVKAFGLVAIDNPGFEADDIIATLTKEGVAAGEEVIIVSSDKDLMQLIGDGVSLYDGMKDKVINRDGVVEKFGVGPEKVKDVLALMGDSSDNVPGVPGIGPKTAAELIQTYGDLETLLSRLSEIKQQKRRESLEAHQQDARISKELVTLKDDLKLPITLNDLVRPKLDVEKLKVFWDAQGFKTLINRIAQSPVSQLSPDDNGSTVVTKQQTTNQAPVPVVAAKTATYHLIQEESDLKKLIENIYRVGRVAVDTETTSLDAMTAKLVGLSFCVEEGTAYYLPVGHVGGPQQGTLDLALSAAPEKIKQLDKKKVLSSLKPIFEDPSILKIGHNIKYDALILLQEGISINPFDDTMLLSYALSAGKNNQGMDELAKLYLGHDTIKYDDVTGTGKNRISFAEVDLKKACDYAAEDAEVTWRLYHVLKPRIVIEGLSPVYEDIDRPLVPIIVDMERAGVKVSTATLTTLSDDFAARLKELEAIIYKTAGREFNVGSPKQLGEVLFDELKLPAPKKSAKSGAYVTGAGVLEELADQGHELPKYILEWRQLAKLKSTYTDSLLEQINKTTNRVHTSFALAVTSTGRLSSTDPNLQNIPIRTEEGRKIREAFIAEKDKKLISLDYSQIELRLMAAVGDVKAMQKAFIDGIDIHTATAAEVFGLKITDVDNEMRRRAKAINFGIIYGISAFGLARNIGSSNSEAKSFIDAYFKRYPEIREYMENTKRFAREHGYVETLFGRRCYVPGINEKNPAYRGFAERAAINAPLQGTAADIIKRAMIRAPAALSLHHLDATMILQVHDELLVEAGINDIDKTITVLKQVMAQAHEPVVTLSVPLVVDAGVGDTWNSAH